MRQKLTCLLLAGALTLSVSAYASGAAEVPGGSPAPSRSVETGGPSQLIETDTPSGPSERSVEPSALPSGALSLSPELSVQPAAEYDLPDRDYQPWQTAYMDFLARLCRIETGLPWDYAADDVDDLYKGLAVDDRGVYAQIFSAEKQPLTDAMSLGGDGYSLYDVDRDGVPELFVMYGFSRYITQCYTFRDGQIVCIGEFETKDSSLYTHPEKDAVLCHGGRMGYYELYEYSMEGGRLTEKREIFREENVDSWTETEEIVPGAEPFDCYYTQLGEWDGERYRAPESEGLDDGRPHPSAGKALLLPIADWCDGPAATGDSSERARAAILAALDGEAEFYGASGDHFYGDVGWTTWEEYIQPGGAYPVNDQPLEIKAHAWLDMNGDGQEELLLRAGEPERADEAVTRNQYTVVLSEQGGKVYAYFFGFYFFDHEDGAVLCTDGTVRNTYAGGGTVRLSFWKDQCYEYGAETDGSAPAVKWVDGPPAG